MSSDRPEPGSEFQQDVKLDKPGIVGARWWHQSLVAEAQSVHRRDVLKGLAIAGGVLGAIGMGGYTVYRLFRTRREQVVLGARKALEVQRLYGWDFGARGVPLVFDGATETPFVRSSLEQLGDALRPLHNVKYHIGTLPEALFATPTAALPEPDDPSQKMDAGTFRPLAEVLVPIVTPAMEKAYRAGQALARHSRERTGLAVLADLPGPQAAAFAAGAADRFEPVLLLDNWPHPHGVVPSHLALSALAYYQPRFAEQKSARTFAEPLFVLDRSRLAPYSEESDRFDNRYFAGMPALATLAADGIRTLFYVVQSPADLPEPGDLNPTLSAGGGVTVRAVSLDDFGGDESSPTATAYYGGSEETDGGFWTDYGSTSTDTDTTRTRSSSTRGTTRSAVAEHDFTPGTTKAPPTASIGKVAVVTTASGLLLGAALNRRGSMNRFSGGWAG